MRKFFIAAILFMFQVVYSQQHEFVSYTTLDGLHNGTINDIVQDSIGRLWLATPDGLMHFDGYHAKNYVPIEGDTTSLPSRRNTKLFIDSKNELWVSSSMGLCSYDGMKDKFIRYSFEGYSQFEPIRDKLVESNGRVLARLDGKIFALKSECCDSQFKKIKIVGPDQETISTYIRFVFSGQDRLFLSFRRRIDQGNFISDIYRGRQINDSTIQIRSEPEVEIQGNIQSVIMVGEQVYFGTDRGLHIYDLNNGILSWEEEFRKFRINSVLEGSDGKIWLATSHQGLISYDPDSRDIEQFTHDPNRDRSLLGNNIFSLYEDFSGILMIGHGGEGLSALDLNKKSFITYRYDPQNPFSISDNTIMCFEELEGEILIGTRNDGLMVMTTDHEGSNIRFKKRNIPEELYSEVSAEAIWDIEEESETLIWLATTFGLIRAELINGEWMYKKFFGNITIRKVFVDDIGNIWIGSYRGLYIITTANRDKMISFLITARKEQSSGLPDNIISAFLLDRKNRFWIGTENGGVVRLKGEYQEVVSKIDSNTVMDIEFEKVIIDEKRFAGNEINAIFEQADGQIWLATKGQGISIYDPEENEFSSLNLKSGLKASNVFGIISDDLGNLWMSTNRGIARYDVVSRAFRFYTPADGIQGNIFMVNSYFRDSKGYIYFGGRNGFTRFFPDLISDNSVLPKIHMKGLSIAGKEIQIGDTLHNKVIMPDALHSLDEIYLPYKDRNFNIHYSVIHFQYPEENQLEYFLEGFDNNSITMQAENDRLIFTNVGNGEYKLNVRAANSDDLWTDYKTILKISVLPPWYKTTLAIITFLLFGITIVVFLIRLLLNRQALQHELRIEKLEKTNLKELNEAKLRFFTNVSHEFRTPLSLTLGPIDSLLKDERIQDVKVKRQLKLARRNARILLNLVDQIIDFRRLDAGRVKLMIGEYDISKLMESVLANFELLISKRDVEAFVNYPDDPLLLWYDQAKIERVFYNLISNAMKYVTKEGSLAISVSRVNNIPDHPELDGKWACISIYNDGDLIPEESLSKVFERFFKVDHAQLGSGIGLAYSKSLLDLHEGLITVENTMDSGVTFNMYLKRGKDHLSEVDFADKDYVPSDEKIHEAEPVESPEISLFDAESDLSILIVEDNDEMRDYFRGILSKKFKYYDAENGIHGLEKAISLVPDIIITDLLMPEMDGVQFIKALKERDETSHIPIILLTAVSTPEDKVLAYSAGADAYVVKPFEINVLEAQIARLIESRRKLQQRILTGDGSAPEVSSVIRREEHFINKVNGIIEEFIEDPELNVNGLANKISLSSTQLYRKVKALTGFSTVDYIKEYRLERAAKLLRTTPASVKEVCYKTGFMSPSYFVKCFKKKYGVTPREFAG